MFADASQTPYDLSRDWALLPSRGEALRMRGNRELDMPPPPDVQRKWDIPELVVVTAAVAGRIATESSTGAPASFPVDFDGFKRATIEVLEAGACGVHIDFGGIPAIQESGLTVPQAYEQLIPEIRAATALDCVFDCNVLRGENFAENAYPITAGFAETIPMAPNFPVPWMRAMAAVIESQGGRLFFSIHSTAEVDLANRFILSQDLIRRPACWLILIGYQYDDATDRLTTYLAHPSAMLSELTLIVSRIREIDPDGFIAVCAAGRAGHYLATAAMLLGLHVRVGTEDSVYRFPHRDEMLSGNEEMVERVAVTATALGRRLATPAEYRALIGLDAPGTPVSSSGTATTSPATPQNVMNAS